MPVRTLRGDRREQLAIQALVEHAEKSDPRSRNVGLVRRIRARLSGAREVQDIDAARKLVHVAMEITLGQIQAVAARQHEIGTP